MQRKSLSSPKTEQPPALETTFGGRGSLEIPSIPERSSFTQLPHMTWEGTFHAVNTRGDFHWKADCSQTLLLEKGGCLPWGGWRLPCPFSPPLRREMVYELIHWQIVGEEVTCLPPLAGLPLLKTWATRSAEGAQNMIRREKWQLTKEKCNLESMQPS